MTMRKDSAFNAKVASAPAAATVKPPMAGPTARVRLKPMPFRTMALGRSCLGTVSGVVAEAMARGARNHLRADLAISVTGVAGPGGGSVDKPVGTIWFGIADAHHVVAVQKKLPDFGRERIREMAAATALRLVLEHLQGKSA